MRLQEEYFKRHNIDTPPIYHVKNANIILKLRVRPQVVLNIRWEENDKVPGHYVFDFLRPNHNSYRNKKFFSNMAEEPYIHQYEQYRRFILGWAKNLNFTPIATSEVRLAIWEMFLYCFDGWFVEHPELEELAFSPVDINLPLEERHLALDKMLWALQQHHPVLIKYREFKKFELNYAEWLVTLIKYYANQGGL